MPDRHPPAASAGKKKSDRELNHASAVAGQHLSDLRMRNVAGDLVLWIFIILALGAG